MTTRTSALIGLAGAALALLWGCGGGGGGGGGAGAQPPGPPSVVSDVSRGNIDGFGSVKMNGKEFEVGDFTSVLGDDNPSLSDLREGMEVEIRGGMDGNLNLAADEIRVEEAVKGEVTGLDPLQVLHQEIRSGAGLVVDDSASLVVGDLAEVHGSVLPDGLIEATFIEERSSLVAYKVRGVVSALNTTTQTFRLGPTLVVDYSGTNVVEDGLVLADGVFVEVRSKPPQFAGTTLTATRVENDAVAVDGDVTELEIEGFVTSAAVPFAAGGTFFIGGQEVRTSASTQFLGGDPSEVAVGVKVEAEGSPSSGAFLAEKVKFKESVRIEGDLVATADDDRFTVAGLAGIEVQLSPLTEVRDGPLAEGQHARVRGREVGSPSANRRILADRVEVRSASTDVELRALVEAEDEPPASEGVTLLGIAVDTSSLADDDFRGEGQTRLGRNAFFSAVAPGRTVISAKARTDDPDFWREVEVQGEAD